MARIASHLIEPTRALARLRDQRRKLEAQLSNLDTQIAKLKTPAHSKKAPDSKMFDRWLDELSEQASEAPALPADFSRSDLYLDHD